MFSIDTKIIFECELWQNIWFLYNLWL